MTSKISLRQFSASPWRLALVSLLALFFLLSNTAAVAAPAEKLPDEKLYSFIGKDPVPAGTVPWQLLRQVTLIEEKQGDKMIARPEFVAAVRALDKKEVKLYGFVFPLSTTAKQKHFLISPLPTHCPFCLSQGPDSMVEVLAKTPIEYSAYDAIVVSGRLELVNDSSLYYRLTNAELIKN